MHDSPPPPTGPPPPRSGLLVRLLLLAAVVAVAAVGLLLLAARVSEQEHERLSARRRAAEIADLKEGRSQETMIYDAETLLMIVDDPVAAPRAAALVFSGVDFADERFAAVARLDALKHVGVYSCRNAGRLFRHLEGKESIERLYLESSPIDDEGVRLLATLPRLEHVRFEQRMSPEHVERLEKSMPQAVVDAPFGPND